MSADITQAMKAAQAALSAWYDHLNLVMIGNSKLNPAYNQAATHAVETFVAAVQQALQQQSIMEELNRLEIPVIAFEQHIRTIYQHVEHCQNSMQKIVQAQNRYGNAQIQLRVRRARVLMLLEFKKFISQTFQKTAHNYFRMACYLAWLGDTQPAELSLKRGFMMITSQEMDVLLKSPEKIFSPLSLYMIFCLHHVQRDLSGTQPELLESIHQLRTKLTQELPPPYVNLIK
jgi:hypothetical protein